MKNLFFKISVCLILLVTSISYSQSCPIPEPLDRALAVGKWKGNFTLDGEMKSLELNLSEKKGELTSELTIPFISKKSMDSETEICQSEELHIEFKVNDKNYELVGRIKNKSMSGRISSKRSSSLFSKNPSEEIVQEIFSLKKVN